MDVVAIVAALAGLLLVGVVLRDIWHTLFLPRARGGLSSRLQRGIWRLLSRSPGRLAIAGPLAVTAVILAWAALVTAGWAIVYWPQLPESFVYAPGIDVGDRSSLVDALYLSLVCLTTLGFGDIVPAAGWLRLLVPLEAFIGFLLLTAGISWVLSVYPVLQRRRAFADEVDVALRAAATERGRAVHGVAADAAVLSQLAGRLATVRADLLQFPVTYYFRDGDPRTSLPIALARLDRITAAGRGGSGPADAGLAAARLRGTLDDVAELLATRFLDCRGAATSEVIAAFLRDHAIAPPPATPPTPRRRPRTPGA